MLFSETLYKAQHIQTTVTALSLINVPKSQVPLTEPKKNQKGKFRLQWMQQDFVYDLGKSIHLTRVNQIDFD